MYFLCSLLVSTCNDPSPPPLCELTNKQTNTFVFNSKSNISSLFSALSLISVFGDSDFVTHQCHFPPFCAYNNLMMYPYSLHMLKKPNTCRFVYMYIHTPKCNYTTFLILFVFKSILEVIWSEFIIHLLLFKGCGIFHYLDLP